MEVEYLWRNIRSMARCYLLLHSHLLHRSQCDGDDGDDDDDDAAQKSLRKACGSHILKQKWRMTLSTTRSGISTPLTPGLVYRDSPAMSPEVGQLHQHN